MGDEGIVGEVNDPQPWLEFDDARNLTPHTYHAAVADTVFAQATPLTLTCLADLKEAFSASHLPFMIDVLDWVSLTESFRRVIAPPLVTVQEAEAAERNANESG